MKVQLLILVFFLTIFFDTNAQNSANTAPNKVEIGLLYAIQKPFYSVTNPADIVLLKHDNRYRNKIGINLKYYPLKKWFVEYQTAYSQEGSGYKQQKTNANYWKNSVFLGYSTKHTKKIILDVFGGVDFNIFLNSKFINISNDTKLNVSNYYMKSNIGYTVGMGLKTKIDKSHYLRLSTFFSVSNSNISNQPNIIQRQIIAPAYQLTFTKFIK
jgi:hypothetical protein